MDRISIVKHPCAIVSVAFTQPPRKFRSAWTFPRTFIIRWETLQELKRRNERKGGTSFLSNSLYRCEKSIRGSAFSHAPLSRRISAYSRYMRRTDANENTCFGLIPLKSDYVLLPAWLARLILLNDAKLRHIYKRVGNDSKIFHERREWPLSDSALFIRTKWRIHHFSPIQYGSANRVIKRKIPILRWTLVQIHANTINDVRIFDAEYGPPELRSFSNINWTRDDTCQQWYNSRYREYFYFL